MASILNLKYILHSQKYWGNYICQIALKSTKNVIGEVNIGGFNCDHPYFKKTSAEFNSLVPPYLIPRQYFWLQGIIT